MTLEELTISYFQGIVPAERVGQDTLARVLITGSHRLNDGIPTLQTLQLQLILPGKRGQACTQEGPQLLNNSPQRYSTAARLYAAAFDKIGTNPKIEQPNLEKLRYINCLKIKESKQFRNNSARHLIKLGRQQIFPEFIANVV
ncbi:MAG: hypothetical protein AAF609_04105 [Cyanobacteria bacterium P01_C01_bin.120]